MTWKGLLHATAGITPGARAENAVRQGSTGGSGCRPRSLRRRLKKQAYSCQIFEIVQATQTQFAHVTQTQYEACSPNPCTARKIRTRIRRGEHENVIGEFAENATRADGNASRAAFVRMARDSGTDLVARQSSGQRKAARPMMASTDNWIRKC